MHQLSIAEMPSHNHGIIPVLGAYDAGVRNFLRNGTYDAAWISQTDSAGGDKAHNNLPPFIGVYYIMKL